MVRQAVRQAHGPEQSRRTHHLTTLSQVEGQITMTDPPQAGQKLAFDLKNHETLVCQENDQVFRYHLPDRSGTVVNPFDFFV
jgi:hypothetical protein